MRAMARCARPLSTGFVSSRCLWPATATGWRRAHALPRAYSVNGATAPDTPEETAMSHKPPKESKKKPQLTAKERKTQKQQKKNAGDVTPLIVRH